MKKLLALVLALVMTMSLVTISNAAFSDADKIDHKEAVEVMNALGVINGMPDGSFAPAGNVTRAEMAKMISIISLGNIDPDAFKGTATDLTDINGHWAEGFIKYCYSQGVIAGRGDGTFAPNANVTAVEAAKMLLVTIGYNATVQGYVGADWTINVIRDAQLSKFFDDLSVTSTKVLTRDEAAQMIYNAVNAKTIEKSSSVDRLTGKVTDIYQAVDHPLLEKTFNSLTQKAYLTGVSYDSTKKEYTYTFGTATGDFGPAITTDALAQLSLKSTTDYSALFGQKVSVVYKNSAKDKYPVYGIYSDADVLASDVIGNFKLVTGSDTKVKVGSTEYKLTKDNDEIKLVDFLDAMRDTLDDIGTVKTAQSKTTLGYKAELIDNDGDGKGDVVIVYPFTVEKVSYVGTKSFTTAAVVAGVGGGTVKFEDVESYKGIAKDDYVMVVDADNTANNTAVYTKLELVSAKAQAVKTTDGKIKFADTWYKTDIVGTSNAEAGADSKYVEVNGYLYYLNANNTKAGVDDFAVVTARADNAAGIDNTYTTKLLKADGTKVTVEATTKGDVGSLYKTEENDDGYTVLTAVNSTNVTTSNSKFDFVAANATATTNRTSVGTFTVKTGNDKGYFTVSPAKYYINDDAVIFVYDATGDKYTVISGAQLKATGTTVTKVAFLAAVENSATGYTNVALAYVIANSAITTDSKAYGYVVDDVVKYEESKNKFYTEVKFWDGKEVKTLTTKTVTGDTGVMATAYGLVKGDVFTYELNADGKIETMTIYGETMMATTKTANGKIDIAAATGYADNILKVSNDYFKPEGGKTGSTDTKDLKITDDTVIIYVNSADTEAAEGGSIQLASSNIVSGVTSNYANVKLISNAANTEIELLVVDVNNDILNLQ